MAAALDDMHRAQGTNSSIDVLDAWEQPRLITKMSLGSAPNGGAASTAESSQKAFESTSLSKHGGAIARAEMFRLRQELCLQRATRNPGQEPCALVTNLRALTGAATGTQLRILGMLTCLDGSLYLEDTHTVVKLDMSSAAACGGYYSEGMVIIAQGSINDTGAFAVCVLSHPPPESRDIALRTVKGGCTDAIHNSGDGSSHGAVAHDAPWILLSNCHLNSPVMLPRLSSLISSLVLPICERYVYMRDKATDVPRKPVVVFMGSFSDYSENRVDSAFIEKNRRCFDELGACLCSNAFKIENESLASMVDFVILHGFHLQVNF